VHGLALSPDGALVITAGDDRDLRVWDAASGACLRALEGHTDEIYEVGVS